MVKSAQVLVLSCAFAFTSGAQQAQAEPAGPEAPHYETVVTASRSQERAFDSPRLVTGMRGKRVRELGLHTTPDALAEVAGVAIQRTNGAGGAAIIRGLMGQHVLILVDGVRLNTAITRFGPNQLLNTVDPFAVRRIEVLHGPGSVLFGSDALGGVINIISAVPRFDPWRAWDARTRALGRFDSAAGAWIGHADASGHLRSLGLRLGGTFRRYGDLRGGRGAQPFSGWWEGDLDAAATWYLNDATHLTFAYGAVRQHDAPRTDRASLQDFTIYRDQLRDLATLRLRSKPTRGPFSSFSANLSFQSQRELRQRYRLAKDEEQSEFDGVAALGLGLHAASELPYNRLSYGLDFYHDIIDSWGSRGAITTNAIPAFGRGRYVDDSRYTQLGAFLLDHLELFRKRLRIDAGGRLSGWFVRVPRDPAIAGAEVASDNLSLVGSLHGRYLVGDGLSIIAGIAQGFRAPNIDDFSALGCSGQGFDRPNAALGPERSVSAELGAKLDLFGRLRGELAYSFTHIDDVIVRRTVPGASPELCGDGLVPTTERQNAETAQIHSIESSLALTWWRLEFALSASWTHGNARLDGRRQPLSRIPPLFGLSSLRYSSRTPRPYFVELALQWALAQPRLSDGDLLDRRICPEGGAGCEGTSGFAVLSLRGGMRVARFVQLTLNLRNLSHTSYRFHGSGLDGPGFSALVGLELRERWMPGDEP